MPPSVVLFKGEFHTEIPVHYAATGFVICHCPCERGEEL